MKLSKTTTKKVHIITLLKNILNTYLDKQCNEGKKCTASKYCPTVLGQIMGVNLTGDPERRNKLKKNIDEKICRMDNRKEFLYCCKVTDISQTDVYTKFSKSLMLIGFPFFHSITNL